MDEKDIKIIEILMKNARTPFTDIAKKLKISETSVRKRVKALEEKRIIKKYTILVDPPKLGYNTTAIVGIDTLPEKFLDVAKKVAELEETRMVATATGDHMILAEIWAKDGKELSRIISEKIGKIDGITRIRPAIILEKIKE